MIRLAETHAPPSRDSNPFATCWTKPGALPYQTPGHASGGSKIDALLARWEAVGRRGQLVGPHGSGKTTLLLALRNVLTERGEHVVWVKPTSAEILPTAGAVCMVEGFERLRRHDRVRLWRRLDRESAGCLVTTHHAWSVWPSRMPVAARVRACPDAMLAMMAQLTRGRPSPVTRADALASFAARDGNLREVWFDLYQLHEQRRRPQRTSPVQVSYSG